MISGFLLTALLIATQQEQPETTRWTMRGSVGSAVIDGDTKIQFVENPVFTSGDRELRASWLIVFLDRHELGEQSITEDDDGDGVDASRIERELDSLKEDDFKGAPSLFSRFRSSRFTDQAKEIYLEGPIEYLENGRHVGQAGAIYLDMVEGRGWIADAAISVERTIRGRVTRLRVLADWLRHSADGSLRADDAVVTTCGYDDPHFHIRTSDLRITPSDENDENVEFDVTLRDNAIQLSESISIPLPKLWYPAGSDFTPKYEGFRLGNSARFGTFAEAQVNGDMGALGKRLTGALGDKPLWPKGKTRLKLRWLGSRGVLLDSSVKFKEENNYSWELQLGGLPDRGRDRGVVRVDEDERNTLRLWYRSRGRFLRSPEEWVDLSLTGQSDPGVQSEFWEKDFLKYEHRDSYLHYRRASDELYFDATVLGRTDSYRTEVNELPRLGFSRFSSQIVSIGSQPILYGTRTTAANLERVEGRGAKPDPIQTGVEPAFADTLGERKVNRLDSMHRIEMPFSLHFAGLRAVPFAEAQATMWDRGVNKGESPTRLGSFAGVRLATSFWKRRRDGGLHVFTPSVEARAALDVRLTDGKPVRFDAVDAVDSNVGIDAPYDSNTFEFGLRSRWLEANAIDEFDIEVKSTYQSSVIGMHDRWLPLEIYTTLFSEIWNIPYGFLHDARYDFNRDRTIYSNTALGFDVSPNWGMEFGHQRGTFSTEILGAVPPQTVGQAAFESASIGSRYKWTPKWEFDAKVSFSILDNGEDRTEFIIRRIGHDFVFELEFEDRTGEGGSSIGIGFRPLFNWRPSHIGALRR